jgi:hypothetical protein
MNDHDRVVGRLEAARRATLARLGSVCERVLSPLTPFVKTREGAGVRLWPSSALGKQLLVRRTTSVIVVTDGISDPWDPGLHADVPRWTYGFEMALEAPLESLDDGSDDGVAGSWMATTLWAATDWVTLERYDLKGALIKFGCLTHAIPRVRGLEKLIGTNGFIGGLVGIPYVGSSLGGEVVLTPEPANPEDGIWLLTLKLLTADEYDWAIGVEDGERAKILAEAFLKDPSRHLSWPGRPSILPRLGVRPTRTS